MLPTAYTSDVMSLAAEANSFEEPGARKPHAGICAGAAGQLAALP
jgi:hypothetical protein